MKTLAIAACIAALAGTARAQGYAPPYQTPPAYGNDQTLDPYAYDPNASPAPLNEDAYDEDGYDVDADVYYDTAAAENYDDGYDPNAYQQFQSALDPYGQWVNDPTYGEVWTPSADVVGADFSPYSTGGHWVLTEYGWTWVSDWDWGWAPFHYGRWIDCVGFGWCWVPGSIWGPGWVSWRQGGGYTGWAPLPPRGVTVGPPRGVRSPWRFVLAHQLGQRGANYLPNHVVPSVFAKTTVVTNLRTANSARYNAGPAPGALRTAVAPIPLHQAAPGALPHPSVVAHTGVPVQQRPWFRNPAARPSIPLRPAAPGANTRVISLGPRTSIPGSPSAVVSRPAPITYRAPSSTYQPAYHAPAPVYQAPVYQAPAQAYHYTAPTPVYHAPAPAYHYSAPEPSYHYSAPAAPSYHYSAPTYSAPAPTYHAAPAPAPSHFSGGSFGGGGGAHFGGGGGRHR